MVTRVRFPYPLDPAAAQSLRDAATRVGVRRLAAALDVSRYTLLVAMAGLPLEPQQHDALDDGVAQVLGKEPPPPRAA
jgi:hypothetical protein